MYFFFKYFNSLTVDSENETDHASEDEIDEAQIQFMSSNDKKTRRTKAKTKKKPSVKRIKQLHKEKVSYDV